MMKDTVLGFKYWVDEPGDTVMYMGSENHRFLFHVAEWLAGLLFPTEEFTNSRQNGLFHSQKGYVYITEWLRQRGRFGFDEWHSNSYYPICIAPLINVYDFASHEGQQKLRQMTGAVLDYMFFNLAADSLNGVLGTTHGRSYGIYVKYPDFEGTSPTSWLLFGVGSMSAGSDGMGPVTVASSPYQLPKILADIATDDQAVVEAKIRQGIVRTQRASRRFRRLPHARLPDLRLAGSPEGGVRVLDARGAGDARQQGRDLLVVPAHVRRRFRVAARLLVGQHDAAARDPASQRDVAHLALDVARLDEPLFLRAGTLRRGALRGQLGLRTGRDEATSASTRRAASRSATRGNTRAASCNAPRRRTPGWWSAAGRRIGVRLMPS